MTTTMDRSTWRELTTEVELRALLGEPLERVVNKDRSTTARAGPRLAGRVPVLPRVDVRRGRYVRRLTQG